MPLKTFAKNLRFLRMQWGLSQTEIAKQLHLPDPNVVQHWEKGRCWPVSHDLLIQLCDILGVLSIDRFIRIDLSDMPRLRRRAIAATKAAKKVSNLAQK
jgi:transcriptional regulator with XRE-family HTH domain